ncbi:MAG: glycosyltransferase family 39 protein [Anaerolineae bacterium]
MRFYKDDWRIEIEQQTVVLAVLLILITLLASGLRLYALDAQGLWYDEGFSVYLASMDLAEITTRTAADIQPPLYYYLLHGWIALFGDSEVAVRSLSALFGVLAVPLMAAMAVKLFGSKLAGLLGALLFAVSPLHVWYGQEVRMYTLLVFLTLLSSYLLLLAIYAEERWQVAGAWAGYTVTSVAALYTHYFAFFVLAFHAIYLLVVWWARGFRPTHLILGGLGCGAATILAYLPWLPNLIARYGADVSYWPGQLKLPEILVDIVVSFVGGESVTEQIGLLLATGYGLILALCLFALLLDAARTDGRPRGEEAVVLPPSYHSLLYLLLFLLLPTALILALSYNSPKFNARYVMLSQPALLLILAGGLASLWERRAGVLGNVLRGALSLLVVLLLLGTSAYANYNAYTDPAFARADFRGVARYLREHIGPEETVILCSGHAFPVYDYYAPDIERHLLPNSPTLDTTRILDYSIADDLNDWLSGREGVWLVLWQDEVVDPAGYLPTMLAGIGEEQPVDRGFARVEVRHYLLPEEAVFDRAPDIAHPADFNFGDKLRLLGYTQTGERQVMLFWEALEELNEDYRVSIILRDTLGQSWGLWDGRPTAYFYPTDRWPVGEVIFGRYDLSLLPGSPPGDYGLEVGVYTEQDPVGLDVLDPAGAPQGKRAMLGAVRLAVRAVTLDQVELSHTRQQEMGGGLVLEGWELGREEAQPGDRLLLALVWSVVSKPAGDYQVQVLLTDDSGQTLNAGTFLPTNMWHPTSIWLPGQAWRGQITFRLPVHAQAGETKLGIQLVDGAGQVLGPLAELTNIQILQTDRVFTPPVPQAPRLANFGNKMSLLGGDLAPNPVAPGGTLWVTLYWKALSEMDVPYTVFVHLLGQDGRVVTGQDGEPAFGARPTTGWVPNEYVTDPHEFMIPGDLAPGQYVVEVGVYDAGAPNMPRQVILTEAGQTEADRIIFTVGIE